MDRGCSDIKKWDIYRKIPGQMIVGREIVAINHFLIN